MAFLKSRRGIVLLAVVGVVGLVAVVAAVSAQQDPPVTEVSTERSTTSTTAKPSTTTTAPEPTTTTLSEEQWAQLETYVKGLEQPQSAPPATPTPGNTGQSAQPPAGSGQNPQPPPPSPQPPPPPPDTNPPDDNPFGLPNNPFSYPGVTLIAEYQQYPGNRIYAYNITGGPADWCIAVAAMISNAGYTISYQFCEDGLVSMTFYGGGRAGNAYVDTNAPGSLSIELRA